MGESPGANRCGASALGIETSVFRHAAVPRMELALREAERARVDLLSRFDRGEYVEPSQQTVADYFDIDWDPDRRYLRAPTRFISAATWSAAPAFDLQ
jgi:hypothetical protein